MPSPTAPRPSSKPHQVELLQVKLDYSPTVCFLENLKGSIEHWDKDRTYPCRYAECPPQIHRGKTLFYAYAAAEAWNCEIKRWIPCVVQATSNLEQQLRNRQLRGEVYTICRDMVKGKRGGLSAVYIESYPADQVSAPFDVRPVICRAKSLTHITLGAKNPNPERLTLPEVERRAPALPSATEAIENVVESVEQLRQLMEQARTLGLHNQAERYRGRLEQIEQSGKPRRNGRRS